MFVQWVRSNLPACSSRWSEPRWWKQEETPTCTACAGGSQTPLGWTLSRYWLPGSEHVPLTVFSDTVILKKLNGMLIIPVAMKTIIIKDSPIVLKYFWRSTNERKLKECRTCNSWHAFLQVPIIKVVRDSCDVTHSLTQASIQPGAMKLVLWRNWMHLNYMHQWCQRTNFTAPSCIHQSDMSMLQKAVQSTHCTLCNQPAYTLTS